MTKERRLGRGLEALLGRTAENYHGDDPSPASHAPAVGRPGDNPRGSSGGLVHLNVYELDSNEYQPREDFAEDEIAALCESIKEHGLIQPIVVRRRGDRYELIAGERRWRAAIKAGWSEVPAQVLDVGDREAAELAIVENLHRKDLNPVEKAVSFQEYLSRYGCTQEDLAVRLQIDRSTIANLIRLLELPDEVQQTIRSGGITQGHARALLPLGDEREQISFCRRIQQEALSVRATEEAVAQTILAADSEPPTGAMTGPARHGGKKRTVNEHLASLEQQLRAALGTKVELRHSAKGRGRLVIHFASHEEFQRIRDHLCSAQRRTQAG